MKHETKETKRQERLKSILGHRKSGHDLIDLDGVVCQPDSYRWWQDSVEHIEGTQQLLRFDAYPQGGAPSASREFDSGNRGSALIF